MAYRRLPFNEYFINTSEDFNKTGRATYRVDYRAEKYCASRVEEKLGLSHEVNYEVHYDCDRDVIQIHFQKTNGKADWFTNLFEASSRYYDAIEFEGEPLQLRVHHGWGRMYRAVKKDIRREWKALQLLHPDAETEVIGWSLGSGQAVLCAQDLNYNFGLKPHLFTYGSVKPFKIVPADRERMRRYLGSICAECWNFANVNDIITYMPPFRGYSTIRRIEIGQADARTVKHLMNPFRYHTSYDKAALYRSVRERMENGTEGKPASAEKPAPEGKPDPENESVSDGKPKTDETPGQEA
ncbi:MAG: hypothetical protein IIY46_05930 [Lachnospiraceae bacterium]|nr:hypothetical protein [Lachnospiraceae bacterium]